MRKGFLKRGLAWMLAFAMTLPAGGYFSKSIDTVSAATDVKVGDVEVWDDGTQDSMPEDCSYPAFYTAAVPSADTYVYSKCVEIEDDGNPRYERMTYTEKYGEDRVIYLIYKSQDGNSIEFEPSPENFTGKEIVTREDGSQYINEIGLYVEDWRDDKLTGATLLTDAYEGATCENISKEDSDLTVYKITVPGSYTQTNMGMKAGFRHTWNEDDVQKTEIQDCYVNLSMPITGLKIRWEWDTNDWDFWKDGNGIWAGSDSKTMLLYDDAGLYNGTITVKYGNEAGKEVDVVDGVAEYSTDRIGDYVITCSDPNDAGVRFSTCACPVDFFTKQDFSTRISGNINFLSGGISKKIFYYVNTDLDEEGVNYAFKDCVITANEPEKDPVDITTIKPEDEGNGWYSLTISSNVGGVEYEHMRIELTAAAGNNNCSAELHIDFIGDNTTGYIAMSGFNFPEDSFYGQFYGRTTFPIKNTVKFYLAKQVYNEATGEFDVVKVTNIKKSDLSLGYFDDEEGVEKWYDLEDRGTAEVSVKDDLITAKFIREGTFDIRYGKEGAYEYYGRLVPTQSGFDFYSVDTRPGFDEDILYLNDGAVTVKEKQGASVDTFYIHWWGWDTFWQSRYDETVDVMEESDKKYYEGELTLDKIIKMIDEKKVPEDTSENTINDLVGNYLIEYDSDTFNISIKTESGKTITGKDIADYLTITDVKDGKYVVGKKLVVNKNVSEGFRITASINRNGDGMIHQYCEVDRDGIVRDKEDNIIIKDGVELDDICIDLFSRIDWLGSYEDPIEYDVTYMPLTGIKVTKAASKTSYTEGDKIDVTGLQVSGVYKDGSAYALKADDYTVTPSAALTAADKKVTITYKDDTKLTASYDITVAAKAADNPTTPATPATTEAPAPTPSEVGATVTDTTAAGTPSTATYTVTDKSTGANDAGEVTYSGETAGSEAAAVTIPDTIKGSDGVTYEVTKIADNALKGNKTVKEVTVGDNIKEVGTGAFQDATSLTTVKLGKNVEKLGNNAFAGCTSLKKVTASGSAITSIGDGAFKGDKALTSVDFSKSPVKTIGKNAFNGDKKLKTIKVNGNKLTKVGKGAFKGIKKKATITVYAKNKKVYKKVVKLIKKSGAKNVKYKFKKKK